MWPPNSGIRDVVCLAEYGARSNTAWEHAAEIRRVYGYREFSDPVVSFPLVRWLYTRAWLSAEQPSVLFDLATAWLVDRQAQRSGFQADFAAEPPDLQLPASLDTAVYRIVQNALTNLARHARARHVSITVRRQGSELGLLIDDDGAGFDVAAALERARQGAVGHDDRFARRRR